MEELRLSAKDKQDARMALLRYYSSECVAHGAYLAALAVGFFGLAQATPHILEFATGIVFPTLPEGLVESFILSLTLATFILFFIYVLGRTVFWRHLASAVLVVKPKGGSHIGSEQGKTTVTFLKQLHEASVDYAKRKHRIWAKLHNPNRGSLTLIWIDLFVLFLIIFVLSFP